MTKLIDAHVLITGGSQGIGLAFARQCLAKGARVSLVARDSARLAQVATELMSDGQFSERVTTESADVTDAAALSAAVDLLVDKMGPVDVLVANAGAAVPGHFETLPLVAFDDQMKLNYLGIVYSIRAVLPSMIERENGHLMLVSSDAGVVGVYGYSAYSPTKFAVRGLAETLRSEMRPYSIKVSCVFPPDTDTPGLATESLTKPEATALISGTIRVRTADQVAHAMIKGIQRNRLLVTADAGGALLLRIGGLLGPYVRWSMDRKVRKAARSAR